MMWSVLCSASRRLHCTHTNTHAVTVGKFMLLPTRKINHKKCKKLFLPFLCVCNFIDFHLRLPLFLPGFHSPVPWLPSNRFSWRSPPLYRCPGSGSPETLARVPSAGRTWMLCVSAVAFAFPTAPSHGRCTLCRKGQLWKRKEKEEINRLASGEQMSGNGKINFHTLFNANEQLFKMQNSR